MTISLLLSWAAAVSAEGRGNRRNTSPGKLAEYRNTTAGVAYVGSKVCVECHPDIYNSYVRTAMGRSMSLPGAEHQLARVCDRVAIGQPKLDRHFEIFRQGSRLYQSEYQLDAEGKEVFRDTHEIAYVIGSGANGSSYLACRGNYLFEAPLSYYSKAGKWDLSPGYEFADYGFNRPILAGCVACHSGLPQPVRSREGLYKDPPFRELAIGCENCHGPGQLHVEERRRGAPLSGPPSGLSGFVDRSIVNPAKLPGWLADNICMNCHQGGDTRVLQPGKDTSDFRPGTPLNNTLAIFIVPFNRESPPQDPLLQHYASMILSKCYRASGGRLSCISCHDPHRQPSRTEAPAYYRSRCLRCHTEASCSLSLDLRTRKNQPDDCADCHMPKQNLTVIAHSSLTNHRIVAREGEPYPEAAFHQTTPELPDMVHLNAIPGGLGRVPPVTLLRAYGDLMASHPSYRASYDKLLDQIVRAAPAESQVPLVLSALARKILSGNPTPEDTRTAIEHLSQAIRRGWSETADFELLANLQARTGKIPEAVETLQRGLALNPYAQRLYKTLVVQYISAQRYSEALATMKRELEIFPEDSFMRELINKTEGAKAHPPFSP